MSDVTILRADRWVDVEAGAVRSPAAVVIEANQIVAVNPVGGVDRGLEAVRIRRAHRQSGKISQRWQHDLGRKRKRCRDGARR